MRLKKLKKSSSMVRILYILLFISQTSVLHAQTFKDSLSFRSFIGFVVSNHPMAKQANTLPDYARAQIRFSRGNFDPSINTETNNKQLASKEYYRYWDSWLKIPVWVGPDIKVGFEENSGSFINSEDQTPTDGLLYAGISLPIARGMWIDDRRAALKQALQMADMNEAEKIAIINKLILEAAKDFWNWEMAYHRLKQMDNAVELASIRFNAVKQRVAGGDEAAIDSIEAKIFLFDRQNLRLQAFVEYQNAIINLSNYLWTSDQLPLNIDTTIAPARNNIIGRLINSNQLTDIYDQAKRNHPKLIVLKSKIEIHQIEQKLLKNNLLPAFRLNYNFINTPTDFSWTNNVETAFRNNYKYGFSFYYPLFLRKERGKLQMNSIKLYQLNQEYTQSERDILNSIETVYNELLTVSSQLNIQNQQVIFTKTLLNGERDKFFNGESTLFLVNMREVSMINAEIKLIELNNKAAKTLSELYWSAGQSLTE